jgi:gliding motility-associated-like protein
MTTSEGSSSIADANGNLLFYTDGLTVWNRNHLVMTNGTGLHGDQSSIQAALVIPWPLDPDKYIVFTTANNALPNGMKYSIVDMSLSGGLGEVTTKNVLLLTPSSEKLTAVPHSNCTDFWVITHEFGNNNFYAFQISPAGVNHTPVVTSIGTAHNSGSPGGFNSALGMIKASPDGTKIASADQNLGRFELFNFNNTTGVLSNYISLSPIYRAFGVEFSPDNSKLYVTERQGSQLWQFDLSSGNTATIQNSKTLISNAGSYNYGALQRANDGKIYMARKDQGSLGVITNPNAQGLACSYVQNGFNLGGRTSYEGLPTLTMMYSSPIVLIVDSINDFKVCLGQTTFLHVNSSNPSVSYEWNTGSTDNPLIVSPTETTIYTVTVDVGGGCIGTASATVTVLSDINVSISPETSTICTGQSVTLEAQGAEMYIWSHGLGTNTSQLVSPVATTTYSVTGTDTYGCSGSATAIISVGDELEVIVTPSLYEICSGESVTIEASGGDTYVWSNNMGTSNILNVTPDVTTTYMITATNTQGCSGTASVTITVLENPNISAIASPPEICIGYATTLTATGAETYIWSNGETTNSFSIAPEVSTSYTVTGTDLYGCNGTAHVMVEILDNLIVTISPSNPEICEGEELVLAATSNGSNPSFQWSTGEQTQSITVNPSIDTDYWVQVEDNAGCTGSAEITVVVHPIPFVNFEAEPLSGCNPLTVYFQNSSDNGVYLWNFGNGYTSTMLNPTHQYLQSGTFTVALSVTANGCEHSVIYSNYIEVYPVPISAFSSSGTNLTEGEATVFFTDMSSGTSNWYWDFGTEDGFSTEQHPEYTYLSTGIFSVWQYVENEWGCRDSSTIVVSIQPSVTFYIPNAFSPNGDGINDVFHPYGYNVETENYQMTIYDRWGNVIFISNSLNTPWDGTSFNSNGNIVQPGVYVYQIKVRLNNRNKVYKGIVTLVN